MLPYQKYMMEIMKIVKSGDRFIIGQSRGLGKTYMHRFVKHYWIDRLLRVLQLRLIKKQSGRI